MRRSRKHFIYSGVSVVFTALTEGCGGNNRPSGMSTPTPSPTPSFTPTPSPIPTPTPTPDIVPTPPVFTVIEGRSEQDLAPILEPPYQTSVRHINLSSNWTEVVLLSTTSDIWPGAIVSAKSLTRGQPQQITVKRKPLTVSVLGLSFTDNTRIVEDPFGANVDAAISDILRKGVADAWQPAFTTVEYIEAFTNKQVSFESHLDGAINDFEFGLGFNFNNNKDTRQLAVKVTQRYYTVQARLYGGFRDYVADNVRFSDLMRGLDADDYPVLINEVSYGRILLFEMTNSKTTNTDTMKATFKNKVFKQGTGIPEDKITKIWNNTEIRLLALGGPANTGVVVVTDPKTSVDINKMIDDGSRWSALSPGYPLIYRNRLMSNGLPLFSYGKTTEFNAYNSTISQGDNLWNIYSFGADHGHDNNYKLERDGRPVAGSPGIAPGGPWENHKLGGGNAGGAGSISIAYDKDYQVYGDTWLFVEVQTTLTDIPFSSDVGRVWLNNVEVTQSPLTLVLKAGENHLEWTAYNQNDTARLTIGAPLATMVDVMNSTRITK